MTGLPLELGIVTDEIALPFREAVAHGRSWGITRYEIRCLVSGRVPAVDPVEWADVRACIREQGVTVTALSPGVFKHPLSRKEALDEELRSTLPRTIAMAKEIGTPLVILFGIQRDEQTNTDRYPEVVDLFRRAAQRAERDGIRLAIENEPGFWCDSGANTFRLIRDVGSPMLGANWDPANAVGSPETPFPDGYNAIRPVITNVHVKDTRRGALIECVPIGEGLIDWKGQLAALVRDRVVEHITIETHCLPLVENSRRNVETLHRMFAALPQTRG